VCGADYLDGRRCTALSLSATESLNDLLKGYSYFMSANSLAWPRPSIGWLRAIRGALGMTTRQLANAVGVTQAAVVDAERTEAKGDITLATLQRYASGLGCEVRYALVPLQSLEERVEERADRIARDQVSRVRHSMALEDQATGQDRFEREVAELRRKLMEGKLSRLWHEI
jgi:predicted DNA-binding mobile mystery protein A